MGVAGLKVVKTCVPLTQLLILHVLQWKASDTVEGPTISDSAGIEVDNEIY